MFGSSSSFNTSDIRKLVKQQECILVGCVPSAAVAVCWAVSSRRGVSAQGVSAQGECLPRGCLPGGVYPSIHWGRHPAPVDRILDTLLKILPCRNFVANGKNSMCYRTFDIMTFYIATTGFRLDIGCVILLNPADKNPAIPWNSVQDKAVLIFAKHKTWDAAFNMFC